MVIVVLCGATTNNGNIMYATQMPPRVRFNSNVTLGELSEFSFLQKGYGARRVLESAYTTVSVRGAVGALFGGCSEFSGCRLVVLVGLRAASVIAGWLMPALAWYSSRRVSVWTSVWRAQGGVGARPGLASAVVLGSTGK